MSSHLSHRPPAREAGPDLLLLQKWEDFSAWLLGHTSRWPKSARFTLCRRLQDLALDVSETLVVARYDRGERRVLLDRVNLALERMRILLRLALASGVTSARAFETAMRGVDEAGRMLHGWRTSLKEGARR